MHCLLRLCAICRHGAKNPSQCGKWIRWGRSCHRLFGWFRLRWIATFWYCCWSNQQVLLLGNLQKVLFFLSFWIGINFPCFAKNKLVFCFNDIGFQTTPHTRSAATIAYGRRPLDRKKCSETFCRSRHIQGHNRCSRRSRRSWWPPHISRRVRGRRWRMDGCGCIGWHHTTTWWWCSNDRSRECACKCLSLVILLYFFKCFPPNFVNWFCQ